MSEFRKMNIAKLKNLGGVEQFNDSQRDCDHGQILPKSFIF